MRIGIYGGTFNPIHIGHTSLAQSLIEQRLVDEVWLMVSPQNPMKQPSADDYQHRINMANLATQGMPHIRVSDFERNLPLPSYTITTLNTLSTTYPQHQFTLIIGADNWQRFPQWYHADEIISRYHLLIYRRPGYNIEPQSLPPTAHIVDTPLYDVSSTDIRNHKKQKMISPDVRRYIKTHHLYSY
ncbi:MAG: nicotinate-nucleotide adenylyltransferase [Bacteroidaceae bacterium]|nr:nicotinate-nucleotide adenylyltransferase [Bacteroidaceae bacterium]MBQ8675123.1 nicotinate-nucleotide adenylyltransferase [Bacteroidaceae bacterium]MBQ9176485.1 nicotinate-nucleotide adenylyltransferase [Bacteroidaceae bacterium]MBR1378560.1 nicotinate-nucleotide adenylyltransferase [Bacteroidaceae bacterium]